MFKRNEVLYRERIAERIRGNTNDKMKRVMNPLFFSSILTSSTICYISKPVVHLPSPFASK
jgi:hypothetical protein